MRFYMHHFCGLLCAPDSPLASQQMRGPATSRAQLKLVSPVAGHYTTLIIDRTWPDNHLAVFSDLLPSYDPQTFNFLKRTLQHTPLVNEKTTWIQAVIPKQGSGTNDCRMISCCFWVSLCPWP